MIDIHCHLLPGIDDGVTDLNQSLELARYAVADGITHMVFTPHIQPGVFDNNRETISIAFDLFVLALKDAGIKLSVAMGAEVRLCPEILPMLMNDDIPLFVDLNGNKTILLELPHSHIPPGTEQLIQWLYRHQIRVLIAHPERNKDIIRNCNKIRRFVDMGCKLQLTAGSLASRFGDSSRYAAEFMMQQGWVTLLATDAHNLRFRPPQLSDAVLAAALIIGEERARTLVYDNPLALVSGMFVHD